MDINSRNQGQMKHESKDAGVIINPSIDLQRYHYQHTHRLSFINTYY